MEVHDIKARLKAVGRTQTDLAHHLGISKSHVSFLLNGRKRMALDTFRRIEAFLAEGEKDKHSSGVRELREEFGHAPVRFVTLEEARKRDKAPALSESERDRIWSEIRELGRAAKHLPRVSDMTDDEILGYDDP